MAREGGPHGQTHHAVAAGGGEVRAIARDSYRGGQTSESSTGTRRCRGAGGAAAAAAGSSCFCWEGDAALKEKSSELMASMVCCS